MSTAACNSVLFMGAAVISNRKLYAYIVAILVLISIVTFRAASNHGLWHELLITEMYLVASALACAYLLKKPEQQ